MCRNGSVADVTGSAVLDSLQASAYTHVSALQ